MMGNVKLKHTLKYAKIVAVTVLSAGLLFGFQNCAKLDIQNLERNPASLGATDVVDVAGDPVSVTPAQPVCQTQLIDSVRPVKVLFLMDTSGSNVGAMGTDIDKKWRLDVLNQFVSRYGGKSNFQYGLATFQGTTAVPKITIGNQAAFTADLQIVKEGIAKFAATPDSNATPYKPALKIAQDMIKADLAFNKSAEISYVVVMISDGGATDYNNNPDNIIPDINSIVSLAPKQISMNSVFYYGAKKDLTQIKYLQNIATIGNGTFVTANSNESLKIDDVLKVPQTVCN